MKMKFAGLMLNSLLILSFFAAAQVHVDSTGVLKHCIAQYPNDTGGEPFSLTSEHWDDSESAGIAPDGDGVSFVTAYAMNYSETDSTSDNEIWVAIVGSTTHVQISDNEIEDDRASVAIAPNGNIIVAWETNYESPEPFVDLEFVAYAVLDSEGNILKPASILDAGGEACVAVTPDGAVFLVWEEVRSHDYVSIRILDVDGALLQTVVIPTTGDIDDPTVAASTLNPDNNNVVIAWEEEDVFGIMQVWFMIVDSDGDTVKGSTQVTYGGTAVNDVNAAIMQNGDFGIVWAETFGSYDPPREQIWYAVYDGNGDEVKGPTQLTSSEEDSEEPAIAAIPDSAIIEWGVGPPPDYDPYYEIIPQGRAIIVWEEWGPDAYYAIINGDGDVTKDPGPLITRDGSDDDADVAADAYGNIVVVWEQGMAQTPWVDRLVYSLLDYEGTVLDSSVHLTEYGGDPYLDVDGDGGEGRRFIAMPPSEPAPSIINSNWMTSAVTVDGVWSPGEWEDAAEVHVIWGALVEYEYYVYVKNDDNWIYVCVDAVGDATLDSGDYSFLFFDTGHDEVFSDNGEDTLYISGLTASHSTRNTTTGMWHQHCSSTSGVPFTDNGRDESGMAAAIGLGESPNSNNHRIYEVKIPMALGDLNAYPKYTAGMMIRMHDDSADDYNNWPTDGYSMNASTWGDIVLASIMMSETDSAIFNAPSDSVYFVPTGNIYDDSAFYAFYGHAENPQIIASPTQSAESSAYLDGDGSPLFSGHIVTFGGRYANRMVAYFEDAGLALVGFANNGTHRIFRSISDGTHLYAVDFSTYNETEKDYFVIQVYRDGARYILSMWGIRAPGTYAGGLCFINQIYPNIEDYTDSYYIFSWTDLNSDGMPQPEEITLETSGG